MITSGTTAVAVISLGGSVYVGGESRVELTQAGFKG